MASDPPQTTSAAPPPSSSGATSSATRSFTNPPATKFTSPIPPPSQQPISNRPPNPSPTLLLPLPHDPPQPLLYPLASSGRGFVPKPIRPQPSDQALANAGGFPQLPAFSYAKPVRAPAGRPPHLMRPPHAQYLHPAGTASAPIRGFPTSAHTKVASSPLSAPDGNGYRNVRDGSLSVVRDRKVRISAGSSLYAMCRSWLKNGFHEETQSQALHQIHLVNEIDWKNWDYIISPQYMDGARSLPRPLPIPVGDANLSKRNEEEKEEEQNEETAEQLSAQDLLEKHIKRAKRVRSRLREERLQRIARYKTRLALLLPPPVEQFRNDSAAMN